MNVFNHLIGNNPIKEQLSALIQTKKLPSTLLFVGPSGVGKSRFAKAFAFAVMEVSNKSECIDYISLYPAGKNPLHSMNHFKEMIHNIYMMPHEAKHKFYVIHEADKMLPVHANALLKTLEEPPLHASIILLCEHKSDLIPTILSRCTTFSFQSISDLELKKHLIDSKKYNEETVVELLPVLQGSFSKVHLFNNGHFMDLYKSFMQSIVLFFSGKISSSFLILEEVENLLSKIDINDQFHVQKFCLDSLLYWCRDAFLLQTSDVEPNQVFFTEQKNLLKEFKEFQYLSLEKVHLYMIDAYDALERNIRLKVILEYILISIQKSLNETHALV